MWFLVSSSDLCICYQISGTFGKKTWYQNRPFLSNVRKSKCYIDEGICSGRNVLIVEPGTNAEILLLLFSSLEIFWLFKIPGHLSKLITEVEWCNLSNILRNVICRWLHVSICICMTHRGWKYVSCWADYLRFLSFL